MIFSLLKRAESSVWGVNYLPFFRLYICFHLFKRIVFEWSSLDLLLGTDGFVTIEYSEKPNLLGAILLGLREHYEFLIYVYLVVIICYAFGIGKHFMALILFILFAIIQRLTYQTLNGGDNLMFFVILYMIFADSYSNFTVTPLYLSEPVKKISSFFTFFSVMSITMHLCLVYFISAISKLNTEDWYNGVALYYVLQQ